MPSEQRLHLSTLLFDLARHVKQFALPAVLVLFGASQSTGGPGGMFGRLPDRWELWLFVMFVPATIFSIVRYLTFRLRYDDRGTARCVDWTGDRILARREQSPDRRAGRERGRWHCPAGAGGRQRVVLSLPRCGRTV